MIGGITLNIETIIQKVKTYERTSSVEQIRKYAVLIPIIELNGETHLLFEVRSMQLRSQPGDICFPGGRVEKHDVNEKQSAIRETIEELGLPQNDISNVYPLDIMMPSPERKIYTYIGQIKDLANVQLNKSEVEEIFTVPLSYFVHTKPKTYEVTFKATPEENFPFHLIVGGEKYDWRNGKIDQHFYEYNDKVIWGLTAKIILDFLTVLK